MTHKNENFSENTDESTCAQDNAKSQAHEKKNRFPTPPWQKNKPATKQVFAEKKQTVPAEEKKPDAGKVVELPPAPEKKIAEKKNSEKQPENVPAKEEKKPEVKPEATPGSVPAGTEKGETQSAKKDENKDEKPQPQNGGKIDIAKLAEEFINVRSELFKTKEELKKTEENLKKAKDAYIASIAEFDNYRRRANEERPKNMVYAKGDLAKDLFPVLDNFKLGIEAAEKHHPEAKEIIDGFGMIAAQLKNALAQHGIVEINPVGKPFDPNEHESLSVMPSQDAPEDSVLFVHRIGYKIGDRLLRPASVVIAGKPE